MKYLKNILILGAILLSLTAYQYPVVLDITTNKNNTLSDFNIGLLSQLEKPLIVDLYTQDRAVLEQVETIISLFQKKNKNIIFKSHIAAINLQEKSRLGLHSPHNLLLSYGDRTKAIDLKTSEWHENIFANLIQQILKERENWVVFVSGHGEQNPFGHENRDLSKLATELKAKGMNIAALNLSDSKTIPDNTAMLVIADTKTNLLPHEITQIIHYLNRGGNFLWLVNPDSKHGLNKIEKILGIQWLNETILDHKSHAMGTPHPAISVITRYPEHAITHQLDRLTVFPWARPLQYSSTTQLGWEVTPLLVTNPSTTLAGHATKQESLTVGIALTKGKQRIVVIGNGHFLSNATLHNYGNALLANNIFNWLSGYDTLLSTTSKPAIDAHFTPDPCSKIAIQAIFPYGLSLGYVLIGWQIARTRRQKYPSF